MSHFIPIDRNTDFLLPPSVSDWLPQDHLARFIVEVIDSLDLSNLVNQYDGRGSAAYHPATLLAILVYGYASGIFSSRKLERACYDSIAFRYIAAGCYPDHDTLSTFRNRFATELADLFVQVLKIAQEMKLLKVGTICLDGTKIQANASRHSALSYGHIVKLEEQLKKEVQELLALADQADTANVPDGMSVPEEIKRREDRLAVMETAKAKIAARAKERHAQEKAAFDEKMTKRAAREKETGKKSRNAAPEEPKCEIRDNDQINLTDEESRIMPVAGGGFDQCYNAQAGVDAATMLVTVNTVTQAPNDKQQVKPIIDLLQTQAPTMGKVDTLVADTGYCSEANIVACKEAGMDPLIAVAKESHHPGWEERFTEPAPLEPGATPMQTMVHKLATKAGRAIYALRKQTVEPVFGIIKSVMGFRKFSMRGLNKVKAEWNLVCLAWNMKRMAVLRPKAG